MQEMINDREEVKSIKGLSLLIFYSHNPRKASFAISTASSRQPPLSLTNIRIASMNSSKEAQFSSLVLMLYSSSVKQIFATNSVLIEVKYIYHNKDSDN